VAHAPGPRQPARMNGLCVAVAGLLVGLGWPDFTLAWTHTIEKTVWEEDYQVTGSGLRLVAARIKGSGAGMEVPDGAVRAGDAWVYRPASREVPALLLARAPEAGDWSLCRAGRCIRLADLVGAAVAGDPATLKPC